MARVNVIDIGIICVHAHIRIYQFSCDDRVNGKDGDTDNDTI